MDHYIWLHLNYISITGIMITCITLRLHLLLHTNYILYYMAGYTCYYMAHYMTSYIIMIGITWSWISLHELHWGYILSYIHITISITWPITLSIIWSITLQITSSWLTLHELHGDYSPTYSVTYTLHMILHTALHDLLHVDYMDNYIWFHVRLHTLYIFVL